MFCAAILLIIIKDKEEWLLELMYFFDSLCLRLCCVLWEEENRANYFSAFFLPFPYNPKP